MDGCLKLRAIEIRVYILFEQARFVDRFFLGFGFQSGAFVNLEIGIVVVEDLHEDVGRFVELSLLLQGKRLFVQIGLFKLFALSYLVFGIIEVYYLAEGLDGLIVFFSFFVGEGPFVYVLLAQIDAFGGLLGRVFIAGDVGKSLFRLAVLLVVLIFDRDIVKPSQSGFLVAVADVFVYRIDLFPLFFVREVVGFLEIGVFLKRVRLVLQIAHRSQLQFDDELEQIGLRVGRVVIQYSFEKAVCLLVVGIPDEDLRPFQKRANVHVGLDDLRFRFRGGSVLAHDLIDAAGQILHEAKFRQILGLE